MAIGAVADMLVQPYAALIIGSVAGGLSVFGYHYITVRNELFICKKVLNVMFNHILNVFGWLLGCVPPFAGCKDLHGAVVTVGGGTPRNTITYALSM